MATGDNWKPTGPSVSSSSWRLRLFSKTWLFGISSCGWVTKIEKATVVRPKFATVLKRRLFQYEHVHFPPAPPIFNVVNICAGFFRTKVRNPGETISSTLKGGGAREQTLDLKCLLMTCFSEKCQFFFCCELLSANCRMASVWAPSWSSLCTWW